MFFLVSKLFWGVMAPESFFLTVILLLLLAVMFDKGRYTQMLKKITGAVVVFLVVWIVLPIGNWFLYPWENQYPPIALPDKVDGVVILGGAVDPVQTAAFKQIALNSHAERVTIVPMLVHKYPNAKILYAGGSGYVRQQDKKEADVAKELFKEWNLPLKNFIFEKESRNTWENAVNAQKLGKPKPSEKWLLVTSAMHMKRSQAIFNQIGWNITPYPVDYGSNPNSEILCFCASDNFGKIEAVMHEAIGLEIYRLSGKAK